MVLVTFGVWPCPLHIERWNVNGYLPLLCHFSLLFEVQCCLVVNKTDIRHHTAKISFSQPQYVPQIWFNDFCDFWCVNVPAAHWEVKCQRISASSTSMYAILASFLRFNGALWWIKLIFDITLLNYSSSCSLVMSLRCDLNDFGDFWCVTMPAAHWEVKCQRISASSMPFQPPFWGLMLPRGE